MRVELLEERCLLSRAGSPDLAFGSHGISPDPSSALLRLGSVTRSAVQPDGRIVGLGKLFPTPLVDRTEGPAAIVRFTAAGVPDTSFGINGIVPLVLGSAGNAFPQDVAVQRDGRLVVRGFYQPSADPNAPAGSDFLVCLNADGTLDPSFAAAGMLVLGTGTSFAPTDVAVQTDGHILVTLANDGASNRLERLTSSGSIDGAFGTGGIVSTAIPQARFLLSTQLVVAADGSIYQQGRYSADADGTYVIHYAADGTLDSSFGAGGVALVPNTANGSGFTAAMAVGKDHKVVLQGGRSLIRLNSDGSPDSSFGGAAGFVTLTEPSSRDTPAGLVVQDDGKVVVRAIDASSATGVIRLNVDGSPDVSFGPLGTGFAPDGLRNIFFGDIAISGNDIVTSSFPIGALLIGPAGAANDVAFTTSGIAVTINVLANDQAAPGTGSLSINSFTQPRGGNVTLDNGQLVYTPNQGTTGPDSFSYTVQDGSGALTTAVVFVTVRGALAGPQLANDAVVATPGSATPIGVLANDSANVTIASFTQGTHGSVVQDGTNLVYTASAGFIGSDSFNYAAQDSQGHVASAAVFIVAAYPPPTTVDDLAFAKPGGGPILIDVVGNDLPDPASGAPLTLTTITLPTRGSAVVTDGKVEYTPPATISGTQQEATFHYTIQDQNGTTANGFVHVTLANTPPPVAGDDSATTAAGTAVSIDVLANDHPDASVGGSLTITRIQQAGNGATIVGGAIIYNPPPGFVGTEIFGYTVSDSNGITATGTVVVEIKAAPSSSPPPGSSGPSPSPVTSPPATPAPTIGVPPASPPLLFKAPRSVRRRNGKATFVITIQPLQGIKTVRVTLKTTQGSWQLRTSSKIARGNHTRVLRLSGPASAINKALQGLALRVASKTRVNIEVVAGAFTQRTTVPVQ